MASSLDHTKVEESVTSSARRLGYENVKEEQGRVIVSFVEGNDVIVCFPTSYSKSLYFFILPYLFVDINSCNGPSLLLRKALLLALKKSSTFRMKRGTAK